MYYFPDGSIPIITEADPDDETKTITRINATAIVVPNVSLQSMGLAGVVAGEKEKTHAFYPYLPLDDVSKPDFADLGAMLEMQVQYTLGAKTVRYGKRSLESGQIVNQFARVFGNVRVEKGAFEQIVAIKDPNDPTQTSSPVGQSAGKSKREEYFSNLRKDLAQKARG